MTDINDRRLTTIGRGAFFAFCAIAAVFLIFEHTAHVLGALPYLLLLACPLMHVFMHHGQHGHHDPAGHANAAPELTSARTTRSDDHA